MVLCPVHLHGHKGSLESEARLAAVRSGDQPSSFESEGGLVAVPSEGCAPRGQVVQAQVAVMGVPPVSAEVEAQAEAEAEAEAEAGASESRLSRLAFRLRPTRGVRVVSRCVRASCSATTRHGLVKEHTPK